MFEPIREDLEKVEREFYRHVESQVDLIPKIGRYIQNGGGKRIRPAVLLMAARLVGYTGELAVLYCFLWLFFAGAGAGPISLDALLFKRRA